jgi:hypothetical protein
MAYFAIPKMDNQTFAETLRDSFFLKILDNPNILKEFFKEKTGEEVSLITFDGEKINLHSKNRRWEVDNLGIRTGNIVNDAKLTEELRNRYKNYKIRPEIDVGKFGIKTGMFVYSDTYVDYERGLFDEIEFAYAEEREGNTLKGQLLYKYSYIHNSEKEKPSRINKTGTLKDFEEDNIEELEEYLSRNEVFFKETQTTKAWADGREYQRYESKAVIFGKEYGLLTREHETSSDLEMEGLMKETASQAEKGRKNRLEVIKTVEKYLIAKGLPPALAFSIVRVASHTDLPRNEKLQELTQEVANILGKNEILKESIDIFLGKEFFERLKGQAIAKNYEKTTSRNPQMAKNKSKRLTLGG